MSDDLISSLAKAQGEIENASLNQVNPHFKSRYADLAAIRDAVVPSLSKNGIAIVQVLKIMEFGPAVVTRLMKGQDVIESVCPIAVGSIYKPQEFGSAVTYARRYSLAAICGIAAEEDDDANAAQSAEPAKKAQAKKPEPSEKPVTRITRALSVAGDIFKILNHPECAKEFDAMSPSDKVAVLRSAVDSARDTVMLGKLWKHPMFEDGGKMPDEYWTEIQQAFTAREQSLIAETP